MTQEVLTRRVRLVLGYLGAGENAAEYGEEERIDVASMKDTEVDEVAHEVATEMHKRGWGYCYAFDLAKTFVKDHAFSPEGTLPASLLVTT